MNSQPSQEVQNQRRGLSARFAKFLGDKTLFESEHIISYRCTCEEPPRDCMCPYKDLSWDLSITFLNDDVSFGRQSSGPVYSDMRLKD